MTDLPPDYLTMRYLNGSAVRRPESFATPWRTLQIDVLEIALSGGWRLQQPGLDDRVMRRAGVMILPAGCPHRLLAEPGGVQTVFGVFDISWRRRPLLQRLTGPTVIGGAAGAAIRLELRALVAETASDVLGQARQQRRVAAICEQLLSSTGVAALACVAVPDRLQPALDMVASRLDEPLLAEDLARACGLSRSRFFDLFAASLGQSPTDYLQSARLRRACELLGTTAQSCKSIATACGFGTPQYFARVFRTAMGQTPGQYRTALGG